MPVALYRVVAASGETVAEYIAGAVGERPGYDRAIAHAARIGGRVFYVDRDGFLSLVFGERSSLPA